uniref:BHLH domain-containing protein n=2 Tax=Panagrellus redivivus TaxID=6233 RepID=A0A7E4W889_PANRE
MATCSDKTSDRGPAFETTCAFVAAREAQMALDGGTPGAVSLPGDEPQKQALPMQPPGARISKFCGAQGQQGVETILAEPPQLYESIGAEPLAISKVFNPYTKEPEKRSLSSTPIPDDDSDKFDYESFDSEAIRLSRGRTSNKASHSVEKRNARERTRVHTVNQAFNHLKNHLPNLRANTKRVSKLKILRTAIEYMNALRNMLHTSGDLSFRENLRLALEKPKFSSTFSDAMPEALKLHPPTVTDDMRDRLQNSLYAANQNRVPFLGSSVVSQASNISGSNAQVALFGAGVEGSSSASTAAASALLGQTLASNATGSSLMRFPYMDSYESLYPMTAPFYIPPPPADTTNSLTMNADDVNLQYPTSAAEHAGQLALYY